jgi:hypothetical protein
VQNIIFSLPHKNIAISELLEQETITKAINPLMTRYVLKYPVALIIHKKIFYFLLFFQIAFATDIRDVLDNILIMPIIVDHSSTID